MRTDLEALSYRLRLPLAVLQQEREQTFRFDARCQKFASQADAQAGASACSGWQRSFGDENRHAADVICRCKTQQEAAHRQEQLAQHRIQLVQAELERLFKAQALQEAIALQLEIDRQTMEADLTARTRAAATSRKTLEARAEEATGTAHRHAAALDKFRSISETIAAPEVTKRVWQEK